jgi:hypothetical protein
LWSWRSAAELTLVLIAALLSRLSFLDAGYGL